MEIRGDSVLKLALTIYNNATEGEKYSDMSNVDTRVDVQLGCIRAVFLMRFVSDLLVRLLYDYLCICIRAVFLMRFFSDLLVRLLYDYLCICIRAVFPM
jgi:hypothetical protein